MAAAPFGPLVQHLRHLVAVQCPWNDGQLLERFSVRCDELAFTALVARHGPMVLRVCRNVLKHEQDAEDAFQASFLVLARNTKSIRKPAALAEWLHGVAYRTAMKAKRSAARRRRHESRKGAMPPKPIPSPGWNDIQAVLDEEIQRLAVPYRAAFVLCVLEGKTGPEAAAEMGVAEGTVSSRLTRARLQLQKRLERRGIQLGSVLAALSAATTVLQAGVPAQLANATIRSGIAIASGVTTAGIVSTHIAALAAGVTRAMFFTKIKMATVVLVAVSMCGGASILTSQALVGTENDGLGITELQKPAKGPAKSIQSPAPPVKAAPKPAIAAKEDAADTVRYRGRVVGPNGQPVEGAKLYASASSGPGGEPSVSPVYATTGPDGHFDFRVPKSISRDHAYPIAALAPNFGAGWVDFLKLNKTDDVTIRLVADDMQINGQIIDLEGKGVPNATISVLQINAAPNEDLGPWLKAVNDGSPPSSNRPYDLRYAHLPRSTVALSPTATTDAEGRFRLTGIGRNRAVEVQLDGPTIARQRLHFVTAAIEKIDIPAYYPDDDGPKHYVTYYGAAFRHAAEPTRPIVGVVRDKDTKKPLAGMTIVSHMRHTVPNRYEGLNVQVKTTTDADGRFRLTGMPQGVGYWIMARPPVGLPYVPFIGQVPDEVGAGVATVDFDMKRGVWIEGKITDKTTGKPVKTLVEYFTLHSNPHLKTDYSGFLLSVVFDLHATAKDGSYRVVGLPGPGVIAVFRHEDYLTAPARDDEFGVKGSSVDTRNTAPFAISIPTNYSALAAIDPAKGADTVTKDLTLDTGWSFTGKLIGPDGAPVNNARSFFLNGSQRQELAVSMKSAEFKVTHFNPRSPRRILFQHLEKGLVGIAEPPQADGGVIVVKLFPGPACTGRLIDDDGKPRAGVELTISFTLKETPLMRDYTPDRIRTDKDGRFRLEALLPGCEFRLSDGKGVIRIGGDLPAGKTHDLGDVRTEAVKE